MSFMRSVRFPEELFSIIVSLSEKEKRSFAQMVKVLVEEALQHRRLM